MGESCSPHTRLAHSQCIAGSEGSCSRDLSPPRGHAFMHICICSLHASIWSSPYWGPWKHIVCILRQSVFSTFLVLPLPFLYLDPQSLAPGSTKWLKVFVQGSLCTENPPCLSWSTRYLSNAIPWGKPTLSPMYYLAYTVT